MLFATLYIISQLEYVNMRSITTSSNSGIILTMLNNYQIFHSHWHVTHWKKIVYYSHTWSHTFESSKLNIVIASCWIEACSSSLQPNNKKYGEKDARKAYWLNLYPMVNHDNCKFKYLTWHFWNPYFHNLTSLFTPFI
jgi:hypothetical protein